MRVAFRSRPDTLAPQMSLFDWACRVGQVSGTTGQAWRFLRPGLYIFNYHRIGDAESAPFDPNVFSCTTNRFAEHVDLIRSRFNVINVAQLLEAIERGSRSTDPLAMITFDDGYRDNFTEALPILRSTGTSAVFFVPTAYIGTNHVPWWDDVAWSIKHAEREDLGDVPWLRDVVLGPIGTKRISRVLSAFKRSNLSIEVKLRQLREATGCSLPEVPDRGLFMSWDEVRLLRQAGMDVGSHTHSHRILGHLDLVEQRAELEMSKRVLETQLGEPIHTLAYPVGKAATYSTDTQEIARSCGYRAAFTFVAGYNRHPIDNPFELRRQGVDSNMSAEELRFSTVRVSWGLDNLQVTAQARHAVRSLMMLIRRTPPAERNQHGGV